MIEAYIKPDYSLRFYKKVEQYLIAAFLMVDVGSNFEKGVGSLVLSIDCTCKLICLILGTRVEAVYNED